MGTTRRRCRSAAIVLTLLALTTSFATASGPFVERHTIALQSLSGEQVGDNFGGLAENIGDIDHDRVNDFITGAPRNAEGGPLAGKVYVFSGRTSKRLRTISGDPNDRFGYAVSRAGDVNRDRIPDYIVGGPGNPQSSPPFKGHVVVYSGKDHSVIHTLAVPEGQAFGASVTGAGDVNRDGYADLIVGGDQAGFSFPNAGRVIVFSGKNGRVLWFHDGHSANSQLGAGVGLVGDVNHDRIPDLVASAPGAANGVGEVYVFSGANGRIIYTLAPTDQSGGGTFGWFFANGAGDINRDRVPDIFVGDWGATVNGVASTGRAYVFSGKDGSLLRQFEAEQPGDGFGVGRAIGDINHDHYDDLIIAAYTSSAGKPQGGRAYIYSGRTGKVLRTITGNVEGDNLGVDALSIGDVNRDGQTDYLISAIGNSFAGVDVGHLYLVAGRPMGRERGDHH